ncbi:MAG: NADH-quinone oxidoreductase subunit A [Coriobacteriia bacterium]|nr:NADH-quinone oxidoreductase subunit A [Coriobacteriia bacterium]
MFQQIIIACFLVFGIAFMLLALGLSWLLSPTRPTKGKGITFECGMEPLGLPWVRYRSGFFVYAILYVIFDIETAFLYPWALSFGRMATNWFLLVEMLIFVAILMAGLLYAWKEKALSWH